MALLSGIDAGVRDDQGKFPADSFNQRVEARLQELNKLRRKNRKRRRTLSRKRPEGEQP
jgi:hypothetical protein